MSAEAIVLAGGSGKRMGGVLKPMLRIGGVPLITRVINALGEAHQIVVVGPSELDAYLPPNVRRTQEDPPGGGPVAGIHAGFALRAQAESIIVAAGDLPFLTWDAITLLAQADAECAVYVDDEGRRQSLVATWNATALERALYGVPKEGSSMKQLMAAASVAEVRWPGAKPEPWYDCDTPEQLRAAEELCQVITLDEFVAAACAELGLEPGEVDTALVLDLAREVAHNTLRPAAPVSTYLLGLAVGKGGNATELANRLTALAKA